MSWTLIVKLCVQFSQIELKPLITKGSPTCLGSPKPSTAGAWLEEAHLRTARRRHASSAFQTP